MYILVLVVRCVDTKKKTDDVVEDLLALCMTAFQGYITREIKMGEEMVVKLVLLHTNLLNKLPFYPGDFEKYLRYDE